MAKVILKKTTHFIEWKDNIVPDADGVGHNRPHIVNEIRVNPSSQIQVIPDWCKSTKHYELLVQDGSLLEVG
jgi:hypothetical protein